MSTWLFSLQLRISPGVDFADEGNIEEPQLFSQPEQSIYLSCWAISAKIKHNGLCFIDFQVRYIRTPAANVLERKT